MATAELTAPQKQATAISKPTTCKGWLQNEDFKKAVAQALPRHVSPDRFLRAGLTALTRVPKLAECSPESFLQAMLTLSQMGLEPDGRRAHLIPFRNNKNNTTDVQLIVDFKGLAELAMRSGSVSNLHADVVCEHDFFEEDTGRVQHKIDRKKPRGAVYAAYAICRFKDGTEKAEVMSRDEIEGIRKRSRAGNNGPWVTDWNEMAKKTVFRRLSKWIPLSPEIMEAIEQDDTQFIRAEDEPHPMASRLESRTDALADALASKETAEPEDQTQGAATGEESQELHANENDNNDQGHPEDPSQLETLSDAALAFESRLHDAKIDRLMNATVKQEIGASRDLSEAEKQHLLGVVRENEDRLKKK